MENNKKLRTWLDDFNLDHPLVIAGPCSAETEKQVLSIAHELKDSDVSIYRAGIWKPRTSSASFQGIGKEALIWMREVKQKNKIKVSTEVATAKHVEMCLEYGIDMLWIGARTTGNPFAVQEIADAIKGVDIPVFIKNPLIPDLNLWVGAIERFYNSGIKDIVGIHRGFYNNIYEDYRNLPEWKIPIKLKSLIPDMPLIWDPSHIAGKKELVTDISRLALDYDFDGLMIESHINPKSALTDQYQQLEPEELKILLYSLEKDKILK